MKRKPRTPRCQRHVWFCVFVRLAQSKSVGDSEDGGGSEQGDAADLSGVRKAAEGRGLAAILTHRRRRGDVLTILAKPQVAGQVRKSRQLGRVDPKPGIPQVSSGGASCGSEPGVLGSCAPKLAWEPRLPGASLLVRGYGTRAGAGQSAWPGGMVTMAARPPAASQSPLLLALPRLGAAFRGGARRTSLFGVSAVLLAFWLR